MGKKGGKKGKALQDLSDDEEVVDPLAANGGGADFGKPKKPMLTSADRPSSSP